MQSCYCVLAFIVIAPIVLIRCCFSSLLVHTWFFKIFSVFFCYCRTDIQIENLHFLFDSVFVVHWTQITNLHIKMRKCKQAQIQCTWKLLSKIKIDKLNVKTVKWLVFHFFFKFSLSFSVAIFLPFGQQFIFVVVLLMRPRQMYTIQTDYFIC